MSRREGEPTHIVIFFLVKPTVKSCQDTGKQAISCPARVNFMNILKKSFINSDDSHRSWYLRVIAYSSVGVIELYSARIRVVGADKKGTKSSTICGYDRLENHRFAPYSKSTIINFKN